MPSAWEKPLATSLAFLQPSDFRSNNYLFFITLQPLGGSTSSKTLHLYRESNSLQHTCFHFCCVLLGILIMSLKVHSCTLAVSSVSKSGGTALASSWFRNSTPPSLARHRRSSTSLSKSVCRSSLSEPSENCPGGTEGVTGLVWELPGLPTMSFQVLVHSMSFSTLAVQVLPHEEERMDQF